VARGLLERGALSCSQGISGTWASRTSQAQPHRCEQQTSVPALAPARARRVNERLSAPASTAANASAASDRQRRVAHAMCGRGRRGEGAQAARPRHPSTLFDRLHPAPELGSFSEVAPGREEEAHPQARS